MRRRSAPLEQSGNTENERAGAHGGYIFRAARLLADERDGLSIADGADYTAHAAGNADQIEAGQLAKVCVGTKLSPQSLGTGAPDLAMM